MLKNCSRCQASIRCQVEQIASCACTQLKLSASTQAYLQQTQYDCLCNTCLQHLELQVQKARALSLPRQGADFEEGLHYYLDEGRWVMTEFYLLQRGYCCRNGCRHCAYGYQPK